MALLFTRLVGMLGAVMGTLPTTASSIRRVPVSDWRSDKNRLIAAQRKRERRQERNLRNLASR